MERTRDVAVFKATEVGPVHRRAMMVQAAIVAICGGLRRTGSPLLIGPLFPMEVGDLIAPRCC